jgi:hypothetical protein
MDNPETRAITHGQSRDTGNHEWTIQRHRQYYVQDTERTKTNKTKSTTQHIKLKRCEIRTTPKNLENHIIIIIDHVLIFA